MSSHAESSHPVLIVDDDERRASDLALVLSCLGETSLVTNSTSYRELAAGVACQAALLGPAVRDDALIQSLFHELGLPVLLYGENAEDIADYPPMVLAGLAFPGSYSQLLDGLHRARMFFKQRGDGAAAGAEQFPGLVGHSRAIQVVRQMMAKVADKEVTVLITGPSGSGKEVVARHLHRHSERREGPFVPVNCGAIPRELLESELFGHEKGAFTGAISARPGRFEIARGGTLFLDEVGDMPLDMQVKLLRVLQERRFERVGSGVSQEADVRIIAATHKDLESMMASGDFREDLYYRLNVFPLEMPALNERREDIPLLIHALVEDMAAERRGSVRFNTPAVEALSRYDWPGNIRELANLIERLAILHPGEVLGVVDLPEKFQQLPLETDNPELSHRLEQLAGLQPQPALLPESGIDLKDALADMERQLIVQALEQGQGVVARAAKLLSVRRTTLVEKMRRYGLLNRSGGTV